MGCVRLVRVGIKTQYRSVIVLWPCRHPTFDGVGCAETGVKLLEDLEILSCVFSESGPPK
jgi:hypothetical protein